jgi:hypothetical protein
MDFSGSSTAASLCARRDVPPSPPAVNAAAGGRTSVSAALCRGDKAITNASGSLPLGDGPEDVFKRVRVSVMELSHGAQTPWESSSLTGDFYFRPPAVAAVLPAPPPATPAPSGGFDAREADLAY